MIPGQGIALSAAERAGEAQQSRELPETTVPLSEVFGPTIQGEGPATGQVTFFVRLGLCNLSCEWCDTPYTWDATRFDIAAECPDTPLGAILTRLADAGAAPGAMITLSGGEPLMHHRKLGELLTLPEALSYRWHVETNGTIVPPTWWVEHVEHTTVSPKVITASDPESKRLKSRALAAWDELSYQGLASFKFVVKTPEDVELVDRVVERFGLNRAAVWVMPEGVSIPEVIKTGQAVVEAALAHRFNFSTRLHTLLWGEARGH